MRLTTPQTTVLLRDASHLIRSITTTLPDHSFSLSLSLVATLLLFGGLLLRDVAQQVDAADHAADHCARRARALHRAKAALRLHHKRKVLLRGVCEWIRHKKRHKRKFEEERPCQRGARACRAWCRAAPAETSCRPRPKPDPSASPTCAAVCPSASAPSQHRQCCRRLFQVLLYCYLIVIWLLFDCYSIVIRFLFYCYLHEKYNEIGAKTKNKKTKTRKTR